MKYNLSNFIIGCLLSLYFFMLCPNSICATQERITEDQKSGMVSHLQLNEIRKCVDGLSLDIAKDRYLETERIVLGNLFTLYLSLDILNANKYDCKARKMAIESLLVLVKEEGSVKYIIYEKDGTARRVQPLVLLRELSWQHFSTYGQIVKWWQNNRSNDCKTWLRNTIDEILSNDKLTQIDKLWILELTGNNRIFIQGKGEFIKWWEQNREQNRSHWISDTKKWANHILTTPRKRNAPLDGRSEINNTKTTLGDFAEDTLLYIESHFADE